MQDPTVLKRFFHDNFVIFRRRSKRIVFLESVKLSMCVYMQIFNFRNGHVTTFRHCSGAYISQMPGHRLSRLAKGTPSESRLSIGTIGLGLNCFLYAVFRTVEGYPKNVKNAVLGSGSAHTTKFWNFYPCDALLARSLLRQRGLVAGWVSVMLVLCQNS